MLWQKWLIMRRETRMSSFTGFPNHRTSSNSSSSRSWILRETQIFRVIQKNFILLVKFSVSSPEVLISRTQDWYIGYFTYWPNYVSTSARYIDLPIKFKYPLLYSYHMKWVTTRRSIWWIRITFLIDLFQSFGIIIYGVLNTIQLGHGTKSFALSNYKSRAL